MSDNSDLTKQISVRIPVFTHDRIMKQVRRLNKRHDFPTINKADLVRWAVNEKLESLEAEVKKGTIIR